MCITTKSSTIGAGKAHVITIRKCACNRSLRNMRFILGDGRGSVALDRRSDFCALDCVRSGSCRTILPAIWMLATGSLLDELRFLAASLRSLQK